MKNEVFAEIAAIVLNICALPSFIITVSAGINDSHRYEHRQSTELSIKNSPRPPWGEAYRLDEGQHTLEEEDEEEGHEVEWAISPVNIKKKHK